MAYNNTLSQDIPELKDVLLGFLDSASNLCEMMNITMSAVLNEIMSIQADEVCGESFGKRSESRINQRNGYRDRGVDTSVGTLDLRIPKLRHGSFFPVDLLERYSRTDQALAATVAEMYVTGTSTRKVEKVAANLGVDSLSKDQVSRLCSVIDGEVDAFLSKRWDDMRFAYLFLDATYVSCRVNGHVRKQAFITAIAVGDDGRRHFVGLTCANAESYASWRGFLEDLEERGVRNISLVTSDAHDGLRKAIAEIYPQASWQRCIVHVKRDVLSKVDGKKDAKCVSAVISAVFKEKDPALVRATYHEAISVIEGICPKAAAVFEDAEMDALTYLSFPESHQVKIRTNNVQERMNAELKRRVKVVQAFPSTDSAMRLMGGIIDEINADWAASSRFMSEESLRPLLDAGNIDPAPSFREPDEEAKASAKVIIKIVLDGLEKAA